MDRNRTGRHRYKKVVLALILLGAIVGLVSHLNVSPEVITGDILQKPLAIAVLLLLLYAIKSVTVFFPLLVLEAAVGFMFPLPIALQLNFIGILIDLSIPYYMGHKAGEKVVDKILTKYPRFSILLKKQQHHAFFLCFFLRALGCLPGDVVTMYFGDTRVPFWQSLAGGVLGVLPGMILATVLGINLKDPTSPGFWISAVLSICMTVGSTGLYALYIRTQKRKEERS